MIKKLFSLGGMIVLFVIATMAFAQDDNSDNACYDGGSMEGKCNLGTEDETRWAWTCGWYIARVDAGVWGESSVPEWCNYVINVSVPHPVPVSDCFASLVQWEDIRLVGPLNTLNNVELYLSRDGSCDNLIPGNLFFIVTTNSVVRADVDVVCASIHPSAFTPSGWIMSNHYPVPADWRLCIF
jgi:hypothetical protein